MEEETNVVARAMQIARTRQCKNILEIKRQLRKDGFIRINEALREPRVREELVRLIEARGVGFN